MMQTDSVNALFIPGWTPTPLNELLGKWQRANRLKKADREMVSAHAHVANIPKATCRRRVSLEVTLPKGKRSVDPDAYWKTTLDALVKCGLLLKDSKEGVELGSVAFSRGSDWGTRIVLEDLA